MPGRAQDVPRAKWASDLADMGFTEDQVDDALLHCKSLRQAVEWLCSEGAQEDGEDEAESTNLHVVAERSNSQFPASSQPSSAGSASNVTTGSKDSTGTCQVPKKSQASGDTHLSPVWAAMSMRFKENVSALKSRQARRSMQGHPLVFEEGYLVTSKRQSGARQVASMRDRRSPSGPRDARRSRGKSTGCKVRHDSKAKRRSSIALEPNGKQEGNRRQSGRRETSPPCSNPRSESAATLSQPLGTPEVSRLKRKHNEGKVLSEDAVIKNAVAGAPTPAGETATRSNHIDFSSRKRRLRSKTPDREDVSTHPRKRLSNTVSVPVPGPASKEGATDVQQGKSIKSYRVRWGWKLAEMGFSDEQIDAATMECSSQREAIEWLCSAMSN